MHQEHASHLRKIIERVSPFLRITLWESGGILKICVFKTYPKGGPSDEMLIRLQGKLMATADSGKTLRRMVPGTTTGEMALLTNSAGLANVVADEQSSGLVMKKRASIASSNRTSE